MSQEVYLQIRSHTMICDHLHAGCGSREVEEASTCVVRDQKYRKTREFNTYTYTEIPIRGAGTSNKQSIGGERTSIQEAQKRASQGARFDSLTFADGSSLTKAGQTEK